MKWRWWRTAAEMSAAFVETRSAAADEEFIANCDLPNTQLARETALCVRRSVAAYGVVAPEFIATTDRYPDDLKDLAGWDSLDFLAWVFELERELEESIPRAAYADLRIPFSVKDLVHIVYDYRRSQQNRD